MKVRKNLEAVFIAAAFVTTFAAYASADMPRAAAPVAASAAADAKMAVVVVKAKRLTAAEKAAL